MSPPPGKLLAYRSKNLPHAAVGVVSDDETTVRPLLFPSYRPVTDLRSLIEHWDTVGNKLIRSWPEERISDVRILPPLPGRDVLCVGKNYKAHATEFARSGYDSSDVKEQPDFPVIFTKRASSIVATGTPIYPHLHVTSTLDYEGELAIIIGRGGLGIKRADAWKHVWGACIINDVTARERQRDHKQFYIGKSLDTFCPMGPYAVPAAQLDWNNMVLETRVNGAVRQSQNTAELIFDIPTLIETCSMGITLQPGDVIATGTPAGVCLSTGKFLQPGDAIEVSIKGLGTLRNRVAPTSAPPPKCAPVAPPSASAATYADTGLVHLPSGPLHMHVSGNPSGRTVAFIHALGGWHANFFPLIAASGINETHRVVVFDLEGMGLSPSTGAPVTADTYAESVREVLDHVGAGSSGSAVVVAAGTGAAIATTFMARYPDYARRLFLIAPVVTADVDRVALLSRAGAVRSGGMAAVAAELVERGTSMKTQHHRPLAAGAVLASLLAQPAAGYAAGCEALAGAVDPSYASITALVTAVVGEGSSETRTTALMGQCGAEVVPLQHVREWAVLEDVEAVAEVLRKFLATRS